MKLNRIYYPFILFLFLAIETKAQGVWLDSTIYSREQLKNPVKIFVDLNKIQHTISDTFQGAMYMWFWRPLELGPTDPNTNGLGERAWKNSNEVLRMLHEHDKVYSYTFTPYTFFGSQDIFGNNQFSFLVKPKDGRGFGEADIKSEDLFIPYKTDELILSKKTMNLKDTLEGDSVLFISGSSVLMSYRPSGTGCLVAKVKHGNLEYIRSGLYYNDIKRPRVDTVFVSNMYAKQDTILIYIDGPNGLSDNKDELFKRVNIFPNPVTDRLFCEIESGRFHVVLRDLMGKLLVEDTIEASCSFDMSLLPTGLYILTYTQSEGTRIVKKIIKQ